jgi:hypothetical protein
MKTRRLRLPATPSPAVEKLRDYLRAIYAAPTPWHSEWRQKLHPLNTADTAAGRQALTLAGAGVNCARVVAESSSPLGSTIFQVEPNKKLIVRFCLVSCLK